MKLFSLLIGALTSTPNPPSEDSVIIMNSPDQATVRVAACIFMRWNSTTHSLEPSSEKPYFYLDPYDLAVGSFALIHNGRDFGVVKVMQKLPYDNNRVAEKVTRSLLCQLDINTPLLLHAARRIEARNESLREARINARVQRELESGEERERDADDAPDSYHQGEDY